MRTKLIYSNQENHPGYGAGEGDTERYEYLCPCGKGRVIEEHDNIPGFRDHDVWLQCPECSKNTDLIHPEEYEVGNWSSLKMNKIKLTTEQMFDIITLGSLPGVILFC